MNRQPPENRFTTWSFPDGRTLNPPFPAATNNNGGHRAILHSNPPPTASAFQARPTQKSSDGFENYRAVYKDVNTPPEWIAFARESRKQSREPYLMLRFDNQMEVPLTPLPDAHLPIMDRWVGPKRSASLYRYSREYTSLANVFWSDLELEPSHFAALAHKVRSLPHWGPDGTADVSPPYFRGNAKCRGSSSEALFLARRAFRHQRRR